MRAWETIFIVLNEYHGKGDNEPNTKITIRVSSIEAVADGRDNGSVIYTQKRVFFVQESREKVFDLVKEGIEKSNNIKEIGK